VIGEMDMREYEKEFDTKDSGERRDFGTGAVRDKAENKGRYDLLPAKAMDRLARLYERGAKKYDDHNWRKGIPESSFFDSALRHLFQALEGHDDEDHLAAVAFNVFGIMELQEAVKRGQVSRDLLDAPKFARSSFDPKRDLP